MSTTVDPTDWKPGDYVARPDTFTRPARVIRRKRDDSGVWLTDGSGLADRVAREQGWTVIVLPPEAPNEFTASRIARL